MEVYLIEWPKKMETSSYLLDIHSNIMLPLHFLGFSISPIVFLEMYIWLQKILGKGGDIVEFQNPLSSHITVGYFTNTLPEIQKKYWRNIVKRNRNIFTRVGMFGGIGNPKVYFLFPDQTDILSTFQKWFFGIYPDLSNFWKISRYVPHMTIFGWMIIFVPPEKRSSWSFPWWLFFSVFRKSFSCQTYCFYGSF